MYLVNVPNFLSPLPQDVFKITENTLKRFIWIELSIDFHLQHHEIPKLLYAGTLLIKTEALLGQL